MADEDSLCGEDEAPPWAPAEALALAAIPRSLAVGTVKLKEPVTALQVDYISKEILQLAARLFFKEWEWLTSNCLKLAAVKVELAASVGQFCNVHLALCQGEGVIEKTMMRLWPTRELQLVLTSTMNSFRSRVKRSQDKHVRLGQLLVQSSWSTHLLLAVALKIWNVLAVNNGSYLSSTRDKARRNR